MSIFEKVQNLPIKIRKIIFWLMVIILDLSLLIFWVKNVQKRLEDFRDEEFIERLNLPKIEMPKLETPREEIEKQVRELEEIEAEEK